MANAIGGGIEWLRRRRSSNGGAASAPQKQHHCPDMKGVGGGDVPHNMRGEYASLLPPLLSELGGQDYNYNTFQIGRRREGAPDNGRYRRTRSKSVDVSGSPSKRDTIHRSWSIPTSGMGNKVLKNGNSGKHRREIRSFGVKTTARRKSTGSSNGGVGAQIRARTLSEGRRYGRYDSRGLDVVVEETGTTPER
jgi:hypothetical protein